jgi:hypothetical protein
MCFVRESDQTFYSLCKVLPIARPDLIVILGDADLGLGIEAIFKIAKRQEAIAAIQN